MCSIQGHIIRSLVYAMVATRADITFAVSTMSLFVLKAGQPHWMAMTNIMRYLKGAVDFKLYFKGNNIALRNWVGDTNDQRSTTGNVFLIGVEDIS